MTPWQNDPKQLRKGIKSMKQIESTRNRIETKRNASERHESNRNQTMLETKRKASERHETKQTLTHQKQTKTHTQTHKQETPYQTPDMVPVSTQHAHGSRSRLSRRGSRFEPLLYLILQYFIFGTVSRTAVLTPHTTGRDTIHLVSRLRS